MRTTYSLPTHSSPQSTDDQTKVLVTFNWHLIFYVKTYCVLLNMALGWLATKLFEQWSVTDVIHIKGEFRLRDT